MSRLFPSRRPSTAINTVLKKPSSQFHDQAQHQIPNQRLSNNVTSSESAPHQPTTPIPLTPLTSTLKEKQVNVLVKKLEDKLPCNSGLSLSTAEDEVILTIDALVKLAASGPDFIVWRICSIIEKLQQRAFPDGTHPEELLESQLFILKVLAQVLSSRWSSSLSTLENDISLKLSVPDIHVLPSLNSPPSPWSPSTIPSPQMHEQNVSSTPPSADSFHSASITSLVEPPPLDEKTVHYVLEVVRLVQRSTSRKGNGAGAKEMYEWYVTDQNPALGAPALVQKGRKKGLRSINTVSEAQQRWERDTDPDRIWPSVQNVQNEPTQDAGIRPPPSSPGSSFTMYADTYDRDETLHGSHSASVMTLLKRYTNRVVYHLSASNWPILFNRLKTRLHAMTDDPQSTRQPAVGDKTKNLSRSASNVANEGDLNLLSGCIMDRTRLMAVLQEFLSAFREMPTVSQGTASLALRDAVLNWANHFPEQFMELWTTHMSVSIPKSKSPSSLSGLQDAKSYSSISFAGSSLTGRGSDRKVKSRELDGLPGLVFDMLNDSNRDGNRRAAVLYPTLAALISISPDRLDSAYEATEGSVKLSSKNNLIVSIMHSLTSSTSSKMATSEQSVFACFEIARFAFFIPPPPPGKEEPSLRIVGANLALELKNFLVQPSIPRSPFYAFKDPIDVDFHACCIAVIFRLHPEQALKDLIQVCLEPERSQAVKLSVVKALLLLVVEAPKYSWQPRLDPIFPSVTPRLRSILPSCIASRPEIINGITRPIAPFPTCKMVTATESGGSGLANVVDQNLQLRVQIEVLLRLEPQFWLFGSTDVDNRSLVSDMRLDKHQDKRERAATVTALSATIASSLSITPGAPCYTEAMQYLLIIGPPALINAALLVIHAIDDHELLRMAINILHTMLTQLTSDLMPNQDEFWRFSPYIIHAILLMEFAAWCCITSSQIGIVATAVRCLCSLVKIIGCDPAFPLPPHTSEADRARRAAVVERLGDRQVFIGGRVVIQKRIRQLVSMLPFSTPMHVMAFHEAMERFLKLTRQVEYSSQNQEKEQTDQLNEWQNVMFTMAVGAREWKHREGEAFSRDIILLLPPALQAQQRPGIVKQFIREVLRLLCSENVTVRQSAKEALGNELSFKLMPTLFKLFDKAIRKYIVEPTEASNVTLESSMLFAEQSLMVMKMVLERMDTTVLDSDAPATSILMGHFISRLPPNLRTMRLKALYCSALDIFLMKRHYFSISQENEFCARLVDIFVDWMEAPDLTDDDSRLPELSRAISDAQLAALRSFVQVSETLHVQFSSTPPNSDTIQTVPRDYHRYMVTLMNVFGPVKELSDDGSGLDRASKRSTDTLSNDGIAYELVISAIANLLKNNSELYKRFCLERCYDPDIRLRVMFMKAFTRVLYLGTQFDQGQANTSMKGLHTLCQMVRDCRMISLAVIQVCPPNEVETFVPVLMRIFHTRYALLDFLKDLIDREVASTTSPSQLFRSHNICNRMLSVFVRQYGYLYLRNTLESLLHQMMQVPHGCSFELDPSKLHPSEDAKKNAQAIVVIAQSFINAIVDSVIDIPFVIREICHHIAVVVSSSWPESKYHAIGAFIFLRFICPAIVSPSTVDIEISDTSNSERSATIQRGLLLMAKIITNLSNNVPFGKEAHLTVLNPFLEKNVRIITKFLSDTHTLALIPSGDEDEILDSGWDDTDSLVLHQFFQSYADKIGKELLIRSDISSSIFASGRDAWEALCTTLMDIRPTFESPSLSHEESTHHNHYQQFIRRNRDRNTDVFNHIFRCETTTESHVFVLALANINVDIVDFELLLYAIFKAVAVPVGKGNDFDIIFDFTSFTVRSRLPNAWLRLGLELLPRDIREKWRSAYMLNISTDAHSFLRNVLHVFSGYRLAKKVTAVSSVAELQSYFPESPAIMASSHPASLESSYDTFNHILMQIENRCWRSVVLYVGKNYLRILSVNSQDLSPMLSCRTVDLMYLNDADDIYRTSQERWLVLKGPRRRATVKFDYPDCEVLLKSIQAAKRRSLASQQDVLLPASQTSDSRAILLAVGLLHACHNAEHVRGAAYDLLMADCAWLNYPFDAQIPWRGSFIPITTLAFIINFTERISIFAPDMTLDFILQWSIGFMNATTANKITCLQYVSPWIRNLGIFMDHSSGHFDESRVRDCIRLFINMTIQEPELYSVLQRAVWLEIGKLSSAVLNVVVDELIRVAIDSESDSCRCEIIGDTLIPISTIYTRARVLTELRSVLSRACSKPTRNIMETSEWKPITTLTRLVLVAGHSPRLAMQNQLYAPEIAYLVTMLAGIGSLSMRMSTYGMAVNLVQALHVAQSDDEVAAVQLRKMLDDLAERDALRVFGLDRQYPSSEISLLGSASSPISVDSLEEITDILLRALELGSRSIGLNNVWRARWISLISSTAFQVSYYGQFRLFSIFSRFTDSRIDDEVLYQMLLVFQRNILSLGHDDQASAAILRCVCMAVPGLPPQSRYLASIFWLAVSIIQAEQTQWYPEVLELLRATVETMERHGVFDCASPNSQNPMATALMNARAPLRDAAEKLDQLSGLSFDAYFGFSLTAVLWDGVRVEAHAKLLTPVLTTLLKASIHAANPKAERRRCLDAFSMPLFLGLCTCMNKVAYGQLLEEDCHIFDLPADISHPQSDQADAVEGSIELGPLGVTDMRVVLLAITALITLGEFPLLRITQKENVHILMAEFAKVYPDLFGAGVLYFIQFMSPEQLSHNMDFFSSSSSLPGAHVQALIVVFETFMNSQTRPTTTPDASSTSLTTDVSNGLTSDVIQHNRYMEMHSEIGMSGMMKTFCRWHGQETDPEKTKKAVVCAADLVDLIVSQ